jgi:voltage-gated potassium channel
MTKRASWRDSLYVVIFGHHTPAGRAFDVALIVVILASVLAVMLDSVSAIQQRFGPLLYAAEWGFTILFTIEYFLRLACNPRPLKYARGFFGIIDLLAILPTYVGIFFPGSRYLIVIRVLRVLRVFRILKLVEYIGEADHLIGALRSSRRKVTVFLLTVLTLVVILGSLMYLVEGPAHGIDSIPRGVYWAIVTLTTVGYGDISPETPLGQALAAIVMIMGYAIIAVPTGIITVELGRAQQRQVGHRTCSQCGREQHDSDARHCKVCGGVLAASDGGVGG